MNGWTPLKMRHVSVLRIYNDSVHVWRSSGRDYLVQPSLKHRELILSTTPECNVSLFGNNLGYWTGQAGPGVEKKKNISWGSKRGGQRIEKRTSPGFLEGHSRRRGQQDSGIWDGFQKIKNKKWETKKEKDLLYTYVCKSHAVFALLQVAIVDAIYLHRAIKIVSICLR